MKVLPVTSVPINVTEVIGPHRDLPGDFVFSSSAAVWKSVCVCVCVSSTQAVWM
jgi:hypothetical protein